VLGLVPVVLRLVGLAAQVDNGVLAAGGQHRWPAGQVVAQYVRVDRGARQS
jgi:hypothetical protein